MNIGYGVVLDGLGSGSFGNDFARNVIVFCVDNSSPSLSDCKNIFLVLREGATDSINGSSGVTVKNLILLLIKQRQDIAWVGIVLIIIVICLLMEKKSISSKQIINMWAFRLSFV